MKTYWRLLGFAKPIEKYAIPYFFYTLIYAVFNTFNFVMIIPILKTMFQEGSVLEYVTEKPEFALSVEYLMELINYGLYTVCGANYGIIHLLMVLAVFITCSALLSNLFRYLGQRTVENMKINTLKRIRNEVYDNLMNLNVGYFSNERKGDIMSKITSDVQVIQFCITNTLQVAFREPFLIVGYLVVMFAISWELSVFSAVYLPIVAVIIGSIVKRLRHPAKTAQESFGEMTSVLDESLGSMKVIKGYGAEGFFRDKFYKINDKFSQISRSMMYRQQLASPMSEFLGITAAAGLLVFGGYLVLNDYGLTGSAFIAYIAIFSQITRPVRAFTDAFANINQGIAAGERVMALLDAQTTVGDKADAVELKEFKDKIEFRDVHFSYESREVIGGVSFDVMHGQTVALVGPSGGGKSTLSDLVPRFYDVQGGEILIDGINVKDITIGSLRDKLGLVSQETVLFNDTIENNIRLGNDEASFEQVVAAAKVANAHDFIMESEHGYQTNIGDRGTKLSGGQRQRLSIARAVLKNPEILILDEATSALDTESEQIVQAALDELLKGRTSIVIAHRLSTIHNADKIVVVEKGRIAEQGTHAELMALKGIYFKLIELQQLA